MTSWGFQDCQRDPNGAGFGSMLGRLFLRTLPEHFTEKSVYTWFPLMTPDAMKVNLTKLDMMDKYDLARPKTGTAYTTVKGHSEVAQVLANTEAFKTSYPQKASTLITGKGFFLAEDSAQAAKEHEQVIKALTDSPASVAKIEKFFFDTTRELIKAASYSPVVGKIQNVNIVRDVLKYVPLHWAATEIAGIPLKTKTQGGAYTDSELYDILGDIYSYIFLEGDAGKNMVLEEKVKAEIQLLVSHIKSHITGRLSGIVGSITLAFNKPKKSEHSEILKRLTALGFSNDQLTNSILAILVGSTVELSVVLTNAVNLLLGSDKDAHVRSLFGDAKGSAQLQGYVYETLRLDPPFKGVFRVAQKDVNVASLSIKTGDRVFLDTAGANLQESVFEKASTIDPTRSPKERYLITEGAFKTLGGDLASKIVASVLHAVLGLPNLRRGPGQSGKLPRFVDSADPVIRHGYLDKSQLQVPWPNTLVVQYDDTA
jgi:cytochrome P450